MSNFHSVPSSSAGASTIRFSVPDLTITEWENLDQELKGLLTPFHELSASADTSNINFINDEIITIIRSFLLNHQVHFLERPSRSSVGFISRDSKTLIKVCQEKRHLQKVAHIPGATSEAKEWWQGHSTSSSQRQD